MSIATVNKPGINTAAAATVMTSKLLAVRTASITPDQLRAWTRRVRKVNTDNGWFETDRTLGEGMALLASEVSEALEAFRAHGTKDMTPTSTPPSVLRKPEGFGSELADVLIRLLDQADRQAIDFTSQVTYLSTVIPVRTGDAIWALHRAIVKAGEAPSVSTFGKVYVTLHAVAVSHSIDLAAEVDRKIAFNATRSRRHGGKRL